MNLFTSSNSVVFSKNKQRKPFFEEVTFSNLIQFNQTHFII